MYKLDLSKSRLERVQIITGQQCVVARQLAFDGDETLLYVTPKRQVCYTIICEYDENGTICPRYKFKVLQDGAVRIKIPKTCDFDFFNWGTQDLHEWYNSERTSWYVVRRARGNTR